MSHILISGGSRGIGGSVTLRFSVKGWNVTYLYVNEARITGDNILPVKCDVSDPEAVKKAVKKVNSGIEKTTLGDIGALAALKEKLEKGA